MASNAGDKCIGKLTLDISDIEKKVSDVNKLLEKIGVGTKVDLSDKISKEVKKQLDEVIKVIEDGQKKINQAAEKAVESINNIGNAKANSKEASLMDKLEQRVLKFENKMQAEADKAVAKANANAEKKAAAAEKAAEREAAAAAKAAQKEIQEREKLTVMYRQMFDEIENRSVQAALNEERSTMEKIIALYQEYYANKAKAVNAESKGNTASADMYNGIAQDALAKLQAYDKELLKVAERTEEVRKAHVEWQNAINASAVKDAANAEKERAQNIEAYKTALLDLIKAQTDFNNQIASGKLTEGSEKYKEAEANIERLQSAAIIAGQKIDASGRQAAESARDVSNAFAKLKESEAAIADSGTPNYLEQVTNAYNTLREAINNYNVAKKANNTEGMATWNAEIEKQMQIISGVEQVVNSLNIEDSVREKILLKIKEAKTLQDGFTKGVVGGTTATNELEMQISGLLTRMFSILAVIRAINGLIQNTVEYVTEYSDKMNEIQMITMKTDSEVEQLGDRYRQIASDLNVSSLSIAESAVYFTRQGLQADEIERRLKNVTMYAKAANVEFKQASEIVTAVVNSMGLVDQEAEDGRNAVQRVADVFLKVGDSAATSGEEIGEAMQKAAASAGAFGMSFEWLASYIATVSETTRQEARTIGTAFNTIIARLHQIKQNGYNSEDETKINDVQKALAKIGITLMDNNKEWRDMDTIFQEIGDAWGELDGKTKSYIATTMAGVKQQNVFLALMNDLGKHDIETTEEQSRAWQLYSKAIDSAGTAQEKYAVYLDSVAAAQERLTIAQERFYSSVDDGVIKGWYNTLSGFIDIINEGTEAMNGWNLAIPALIAGIGALIAIIVKFDTISASLMAHPVIATIGIVSVALVGLITAISGVAAAAGSAKQRFDEANTAFAESQERIDRLTAAKTNAEDIFGGVAEGAKLTADDLQKYSSKLEQIAQISPVTKQIVDQLKEGLIDQAEAAKQLNEEFDRLISNENKYSQIQLMKKYANWQEEKTDSDRMAYFLATSWKDIASQYTTGGAENWSDSDKFAYNLKQNYQMSDTYYKMPDAVKKEIDNMLESMKDAIKRDGSKMSEDEKWGIIGQIIWQEFVGTDTYSIQDALKSKAESVINEAISSFSAGLSNIETAALRKRLTDMLFGEDGIIDENEYQQIVPKMLAFMADSSGNLKFTNVEIAEALGESLFGTASSGVFEDYGEEFSKKFIDGYESALKAGFTDTDIASIFKESGLPTIELDNIADILTSSLQQSIAKAMGESDWMSAVNLIDSSWFEDLDLATLKLMNDMLNLGADINDVFTLADESNSVEEFKNKLIDLAKEMGVDVPDGGEQTVKSFADIAKEAKNAITAIDKVLTEIEKGKTIKFSDVLNIAKTHPEIIQFTRDADTLKKKLEEIKQATREASAEEMYQNLLDSEDFFKSTDWSNYINAEGEAYSSLRDMMTHEDTAIESWLRTLIEDLLELTDDADDATVSLSELIKTVKSVRTDYKNLDTLYDTVVKNGKATFEDVLPFAETHSELLLIYDDYDAVLQKIQELKAASKEKLGDAVKDLLWNTTDEASQGEYAGKIKEAGVTNLKEYRALFDDASAMAKEIDAYVSEAADRIKGAAEEEEKAAETWLEAQEKIIRTNEEVNWAKSNGFEEQVDELRKKMSDGGVEGLTAATEYFNGLSAEMRNAIENEYPGLIKAMREAEKVSKDEKRSLDDVARAQKDVNAELNKVERFNAAKHFENTNNAIKKLGDGTINVTDAYKELNKDLNSVTKAYEDILKVQEKERYNADPKNETKTDKDITSTDVSNLASLLNMTTDEILADFPSAVEMFDELIGKTGELQSTIEALNREAFIRITGVSEADFSDIMNGLLVVQDEAEKTVQELLKTGQWEIETVKLNSEMPVWQMGKDGSITYNEVGVSGYQNILKPKSGNPFNKASTVNNKTTEKQKRSGGGGGGKNDNFRDKNVTTEVEKMLDMMSQIAAIQAAQQSYYQSQQKYYTQTKEIQGVIAYMEREKELLESENPILEDNVKRIEEFIEKKKQELAALSTSDDEYKDVADDLDKLQKAHQTYTKQLVDNRTAIDKLNESIKDQNDKIRQMEIELRNTILKAIEDREKRVEDMLNAEIQMENKILDLIKRRYEKERDQIIETTNLKIDSLNEERDLLDEQLRIRKEQEETEDKQLKLRELEAKYQRIIADPTRRKEAQGIKTEIDSLRKEMAWDVAEAEVKAQQDSIDQQIESLEDYVEYVENYYEDLFEHPQKLIEEMRGVISRTHSEIIEWMKANDEEYAKSSENTRNKMVSEWSDTLNQMYGIIQTYWDEVEMIIAQGEDYIIEFLKENSADYREAGKLQAEAYVDEWKEQLEDLRKAHKEVVADIAASYETIAQYEGTGSSKSGGGGGGGSGSGKTKYKFHYNGIEYDNKGKGYKTYEDAEKAISKLASNDRNENDKKYPYSGTQHEYFNTEIGKLERAAKLTIAAYAKGGYVYSTGPAWLDGTEQNPEAVLNPYQTKLFETMVQALDGISRVTIPTMPNFGDVQTAGSSPVSVGDIIVNVDNLDTDDDYEEMAEKVSAILMDRIGRTAAIGGLRIRSI